MLETWMRREPILAATGLLMLCLVPPMLFAMGLDGRLFDGQNVWIKPLKFAFALVIYLLTLVYFARWLPQGTLNARPMRLYLAVVSLAVIVEMIWIGGAAAYATASHYNRSNAIMALMYPVMGLFAVILTSASGVFGWLIWRNRDAELDPALRLAIALGLVLTAVLTVFAASTLSSQPGHFVGTPVTGAAIPVLGWSREVGDLRVAHFLATHAMHFVPALGLLLLLIPSAGLRKFGALLGSLAYTALVVVTMIQALQGRPVLPMI